MYCFLVILVLKIYNFYLNCCFIRFMFFIIIKNSQKIHKYFNRIEEVRCIIIMRKRVADVEKH